MKKRIIIVLFIAWFLLSAVPLLAQEKDDPCGCGEENPAREEEGVVDESLATWVRESKIVYETEEGNLYWWLEGYNEKAKGFAARGDEAGLKDYIREIAGNYRFGNESDEEGFIDWALETRPWQNR